MIMRDKEEVAKLIREVFDAYCKSFDDSLNRLKIWPWTDKKTVIHESNQIHRFLDAYQKTGSNIVTWMELPVCQKNESLESKVIHIDAFIVDNDRKLIFFIEAKRFSRPSQVESLGKDICRLFKLSHEIYVGNGNFRGINLFDYDAYMIPLADVWDYRGKWCKEFADNWERESYDLEGIYSYRLATMKKSLTVPGEQEEGQYHLLAALLPVFDSEEYNKEVEIQSHESGPASSPSILVWADDVRFEALLASVNKKVVR